MHINERVVVKCFCVPKLPGKPSKHKSLRFVAPEVILDTLQWMYTLICCPDHQSSYSFEMRDSKKQCLVPLGCP